MKTIAALFCVLLAVPALAQEPTSQPAETETETEAAPEADYNALFATCVAQADCDSQDDPMGMCEVDCCEAACPQAQPSWMTSDPDALWPDDCMNCGQVYGQWE